ncbi:hypothetical protein GCM10023189_20920 [Nibrella saemangeumensis]|uniref:Uncharacterized protein n=1 Tax=Nibrella saemangeumensis TaxID=1084526 RepID=A0ABP8MQF4_9BACT
MKNKLLAGGYLPQRVSILHIALNNGKRGRIGEKCLCLQPIANQYGDGQLTSQEIGGNGVSDAAGSAQDKNVWLRSHGNWFTVKVSLT